MIIPYLAAGIAAIIAILGWIDLLCFLFSGERCFKKLKYALHVMVMLGPVGVLLGDRNAGNDCCGDSAIFSPTHRLSATVMISLCLAAFFYSTFRKKLAPPLLEVILNCLLIIGVVLDIIVGIQMKEGQFWFFGNLPVATLFLLVLGENHTLAITTLRDQQPPDDEGRVIRICRKLVSSPAWLKFPLLLLLCLPVITIVIATLLLFGQKPDSIVRAFTDTYKHGFSQLDYQCAGVVCGGHFLCTIAAKGNPRLVRPVRTGIRAGRLIQCNRQLLISNAFEELLEQKLPWLHKPIRSLYNKVGDQIHRYYGAFNRAWVSNTIYILMKPLEWVFLLVLYLADPKPETRIAQQYLHRNHRRLINNYK